MRSRRQHEREPAAEHEAPAVSSFDSSVQALVHLQQTAGNAAVSRLIAGRAPARPVLQRDDFQLTLPELGESRRRPRLSLLDEGEQLWLPPLLPRRLSAQDLMQPPSLPPALDFSTPATGRQAEERDRRPGGADGGVSAELETSEEFDLNVTLDFDEISAGSLASALGTLDLLSDPRVTFRLDIDPSQRPGGSADPAVRAALAASITLFEQHFRANGREIARLAASASVQGGDEPSAGGEVEAEVRPNPDLSLTGGASVESGGDVEGRVGGEARLGERVRLTAGATLRPEEEHLDVGLRGGAAAELGAGIRLDFSVNVQTRTTGDGGLDVRSGEVRLGIGGRF